MRAGEVLDGRFELVRQIGLGGMGSVWEARDRVGGRRVAIKSLHEHLIEDGALVARFLQEAQAALEARLSGHIIEVIDVVQPPERPPYQVMEYLEGEDLEQIIDREGALEPTRAVDLIIQTCEALAEVHRQGLIHRDIKPENLFVTRLPDGREWIKLLDFGVVKFKNAAGGQARSLTGVGHTVGTPQYMAPEQATGLGQLDHRADLYSTGVVLYELLTGELPYDDEDQRLVMRMHARGRPPALRDHRQELSKELERVVLKAMAVNPARRFQSMFELADALSPFGSQAGRLDEGRGALRVQRTVKESLDTGVLEALVTGERQALAQGERSRRALRVLVIAAITASALSLVLLSVLLIPRGCVEEETRAQVEETQILFDGGPDGAISPAVVDPVVDLGEAGPPPAEMAFGSDAALPLDDDAPDADEASEGGDGGELPDGGSGETTHQEWLERYGKRLDRRSLARSLARISPKVGGCLRGARPPGTKISVHFWVASDGRIEFRRTRPAVHKGAERCLRQVARTSRFERTKVPPFVATLIYTVPSGR